MTGRYLEAARIPEIQPPLPPDSVLHAVKAMYACAVACVIRAIIYVLTLSATQAAIDTPQRVMLIAVVIAASAVPGLLVWIARSCESGKNWARVIATVICVIGVSGAIYDLGSNPGAAARVFSGIDGLKGLVVVVLLWLGSSNDYFRSCKRPRGAPSRRGALPMKLMAAFEPIWILAAAGYFARRRGILSDSAVSVLGEFVFRFAIPSALFLTLANMRLSALTGRPLAAFGASTALVIGIGWYGAGRWFGRQPGERAIWAMAGGYVNSANLGIPIAMQLLGSISFLVEVVLLQVLVVTPIILIALDRHSAANGRIRFQRIATLAGRNPVILASALGAVASMTHLHPPSALQTTLTLLSSAAVSTALIALGASLSGQSMTSGRGEERDARTRPREAGFAEISVIAALKLVTQPVMAYAIGAFALRLSHPQLLAVVVCAGLPTAQNTFIFAQRYGVGEALANRSVLLTTALSMATLAAAVALLGR
jgi:malonate transporter